MSMELKFSAEDSRAGMTLQELENALSRLPEGPFRLKARVGLGGQVQSLIFVQTQEGAEK